MATSVDGSGVAQSMIITQSRPTSHGPDGREAPKVRAGVETASCSDISDRDAIHVWRAKS